eukprot:TRINITY_DN1201_c0_g2_i2.p1 TRINITY_DN1201_c0_g2~~TRINITY_DN1201_c0_g2_i2.p1  ORF type:complete len:186 (-),score=25.74 TRINITY_DN1201_c0_g2_i2:87-602(-)
MECNERLVLDIIPYYIDSILFLISMTTLALELIPLSIDSVSPLNSSALLDDRGSESTPTDSKVQERQSVKAIKEEIEYWEETYKSVVFRKCIAERKKKLVYHNIQEIDRKSSIIKGEISKLKESYRKLKNVSNAKTLLLKASKAETASANYSQKIKVTQELAAKDNKIQEL